MKARYPQVSVIIPTFNRESFLPSAIDSVLSQTFQDLELIVVDDGSVDGTQALIQEISDSRFKSFQQANKGVSAARNLGIGHASGRWIAFLDSDDRWMPQKLQEQLRALGSRPEFRAVYTDEIWIRRGRRVNPKKRHRKFSGWIYQHCLPLCIISPSSILLERDLLTEIGLFESDYPVCEDYEMWLRLSAEHPILFLPEPLIVKNGGHQDQLSQSHWGLDRFRLRALISRLESEELTPLQKRWTRREIVRKSRILAQGCEKREKLEDAARYGAICDRYDGDERPKR